MFRSSIIGFAIPLGMAQVLPYDGRGGPAGDQGASASGTSGGMGGGRGRGGNGKGKGKGKSNGFDGNPANEGYGHYGGHGHRGETADAGYGAYGGPSGDERGEPTYGQWRDVNNAKTTAALRGFRQKANELADDAVDSIGGFFGGFFDDEPDAPAPAQELSQPARFDNALHRENLAEIGRKAEEKDKARGRLDANYDHSPDDPSVSLGDLSLDHTDFADAPSVSDAPGDNSNTANDSPANDAPANDAPTNDAPAESESSTPDYGGFATGLNTPGLAVDVDKNAPSVDNAPAWGGQPDTADLGRAPTGQLSGELSESAPEASAPSPSESATPGDATGEAPLLVLPPADTVTAAPAPVDETTKPETPGENTSPYDEELPPDADPWFWEELRKRRRGLAADDESGRQPLLKLR